MQERVSKIEMYKKTMNNNYRKIHLNCLFVNEKQDVSFSVATWPIPSSTMGSSCLYILEEILVFYGASHDKCLVERAFLSNHNGEQRT